MIARLEQPQHSDKSNADVTVASLEAVNKNYQVVDCWQSRESRAQHRI
jgi:hypothetical protein